MRIKGKVRKDGQSGRFAREQPVEAPPLVQTSRSRRRKGRPHFEKRDLGIGNNLSR